MATNIKFDKREDLVKLLKNEESFLLQIFSLESIAIFEEFLTANQIEFVKDFTSLFKPKKNTISLLLDDGAFPDSVNLNTKNKIILYSNKRHLSFIPMKFQLNSSERVIWINDEAKLKCNKNVAVSSIITEIPDIHNYTANSLNYVQSVIIMCLIKEGNFKKLCHEIKTVDPDLDNSFNIKLELNWLCLNRFCKKTGSNYKLSISNETVQKICTKIGFDKILQIQNKR